MPQVLTTVSKDAGIPLQINGRALIEVHEQIVGILQSRLGQNHGDLLAEPRIESDGSISWITHLAGLAAPVADLPEEARMRLQQRADRIVADIRGLALQLRAEGPAAEVVAQMLDTAVQTAPGQWLYSVGGKPVLVMWGHAASGKLHAGATGSPPTQSSASGKAQDDSPTKPEDLGTPPTSAIRAGKGPNRWLLWFLLGLMLLGLLLWVLEKSSGRLATGSGLAEQIAQAEERNKLLEEEVARKRAEPPQLICVPDVPSQAPNSSPPAAQPVPAPVVPPLHAEPPTAPKSVPATKPAPPKPEAPKPEAPKLGAPKPGAPKPGGPKHEAPKSEAPKAESPQRQACKPRQPGDEPEVVMIVDASGSMRQPFGTAPSRLDAAKRASESMIRGLPADVDVALVDFGACGQVRRDKFYSASQRGALVAEINGLTPKQGTPLADAIRRAGNIASDTAESVIVIVSDGGDSCGGDPCAAARSIKASKPGVTINVIDLADTPRERQVLQCIAGAGGGRLLSPGDPLDMNRKMREAAGAANCPP